MSKFAMHAPVDPECPEVDKFMTALFNDPMSSMCGCLDDVVEGFEKKHIAKCARCRAYGCANIEVAGP